jgi:CRP-like cAMP-binding protein
MRLKSLINCPIWRTHEDPDAVCVTSQAARRFFRPEIPATATARTGLLKVVISSPRGDERAGVTLADPEHSGPGSIAGELALIDGAPRSASVIAIRDCELSFISRAEFTE